jgi:hypothetical protein
LVVVVDFLEPAIVLVALVVVLGQAQWVDQERLVKVIMVEPLTVVVGVPAPQEVVHPASSAVVMVVVEVVLGYFHQLRVLTQDMLAEGVEVIVVQVLTQLAVVLVGFIPSV